VLKTSSKLALKIIKLSNQVIPISEPITDRPYANSNHCYWLLLQTEIFAMGVGGVVRGREGTKTNWEYLNGIKTYFWSEEKY
jgi:hypothetical protein